MGGIKIARGNSRHNIEKKLKELEEEKNKGNITLEEYDTLRIRFERKLGNKETVSKLQESKGFKPSRIKEKKAKKEEFFDEFVDKYSLSDGKDYGQIQRSKIFSSGTKKTLILLFILLAFGVGILAGLTVINNDASETISNVTVTDSAFSANQTMTSASNTSTNTSNVTYTTKKQSTKSSKNSTAKSSSSYSSSSSGSGSSGSSSGSSGSNSRSSGSSSSGSSSNSRTSGSGSSGSSQNYRGG